MARGGKGNVLHIRHNPESCKRWGGKGSKEKKFALHTKEAEQSRKANPGQRREGGYMIPCVFFLNYCRVFFFFLLFWSRRQKKKMEEKHCWSSVS